MSWSDFYNALAITPGFVVGGTIGGGIIATHRRKPGYWLSGFFSGLLISVFHVVMKLAHLI